MSSLDELFDDLGAEGIPKSRDKFIAYTRGCTFIVLSSIKFDDVKVYNFDYVHNPELLLRMEYNFKTDIDYLKFSNSLLESTYAALKTVVIRIKDGRMVFYTNIPTDKIDIEIIDKNSIGEYPPVSDEAERMFDNVIRGIDTDWLVYTNIKH